MSIHVWIVVVDQSEPGKRDGYSATGPFMTEDQALAKAGEVSERAMAGEYEINSVIAMPCFAVDQRFFDNLRSEA